MEKRRRRVAQQRRRGAVLAGGLAAAELAGVRRAVVSRLPGLTAGLPLRRAACAAPREHGDVARRGVQVGLLALGRGA